MLYCLMLLGTECFPYSFKMYLAFPRNHINNRGDNILSIPNGLSDCFFIYKILVLWWFRIQETSAECFVWSPLWTRRVSGTEPLEV